MGPLSYSFQLQTEILNSWQYKEKSEEDITKTFKVIFRIAKVSFHSSLYMLYLVYILYQKLFVRLK